MMPRQSLTATRLRIILVVSLFLILALGTAGFLLIVDGLNQTATTLSKTQTEATASRDNLQNLQNTQNQLKEHQATVERARNIVAESQSYQYQDQIITDISSYAGRAGVSISNIDFGTGSAPGSSAAAGATPPQAAAPVPSGVKSSSVTITLKNPVNYTALMRFIHSVEQNLTRMQISKVSLSRTNDGNLNSDTLTLQVYVR